MNKILATIAGVALTVLPAAAFAGSTTGNVAVSANVVAACSLNTSGPGSAMTFANYNPSAAAAQPSAGGSESIICTNSTPWTLSVPATTSLTGPNPGDSLAISSIGDSPSSGTGSGAAQPFTVSGSAAAGQYSSPGAYSGSVTITANF